ncbi:hypothetical protein IV38_GL000086 [Lactobacillus selangorensis]|uniref:Uncharacterized protein n=2 Tax=Lactobacillus selangorensis TaxID=81857 RepID=A0A0R2G239_9LACO|nr:hypothetical protein IV38_GL000086 [Lactobacillus selangorensis]KRN31436.1 hypothetical protein IV40_GL001432 [Lactobacillus selangorensis]
MTTTGDISEYDSLSNLVQEKEARVWGMKHHVPFYKIKKASKEDVDDDYEVAEELGVQVDYLHEVGSAYGLKYKHLDE